MNEVRINNTLDTVCRVAVTGAVVAWAVGYLIRAIKS